MGFQLSLGTCWVHLWVQVKTPTDSFQSPLASSSVRWLESCESSPDSQVDDMLGQENIAASWLWVCHAWKIAFCSPSQIPFSAAILLTPLPQRSLSLQRGGVSVLFRVVTYFQHLEQPQICMSPVVCYEEKHLVKAGWSNAWKMMRNPVSNQKALVVNIKCFTPCQSFFWLNQELQHNYLNILIPGG